MDDSDFYMMRFSLQNTLDCDVSEEDMAGFQTVMDLLKYASDHA
jgi:acyl carrier protein